MGNFKKHIHPLLRRDKRQDIDSDSNFAVLNAIENVLTEAEQATIKSRIQSSLESATGSFLDKWGDWLGIYRAPSEEDEKYRQHIIDHTLLKRGTIPSIIDAIKWFLKDNDARVEVYEPWKNIFYTNKSKLNGEDHLQGNYYRFAIIDITLDRPFPPEIMEIIWAFKPAGVLFYVGYDSGLDVTQQWVESPISDAEITSRQTLDRSTGGHKVIRGTFKPDDTRDAGTDANVFHTNNSLLNGTDVLAGNINRTRTFLHMVGESSGRNLQLDTGQEIISPETVAILEYLFRFDERAPHVKDGDWMTISFKVRNLSNENVGNKIGVYLRAKDQQIVDGTYARAVEIASDWTEVVHTFQVLDSQPSYIDTKSIAIRKTTSEGNISTIGIAVKEFKIELGKVKTPWTPAPEDSFTNVPDITDYNPLMLTDTLNLRDIEKQMAPVAKEAHVALSEKDTLQHIVKANLGYLAMIYDVRSFLQQYYKEDYEAYTGESPNIVNKARYSAFMQEATISLGIRALAGISTPVNGSLRVFDYTTNKFEVLKNYQLTLEHEESNIQLGAIQDYLNAEGLLTFQLVLNNKGQEIPVEIDYLNLTFANQITGTYGIKRDQEVSNQAEVLDL